jgi:hypothetical protein
MREIDVKSKFRILAVGAASALVASIAAAPLPATAVTANYSYFGATGGTQIQAVGTTISSSMTAMSQVSGLLKPATTTNRLLTVSAPPLARVGTIETSETATAVGDGWNLTGKARTANINLLDGLIVINAVTTVTSAQFDSVGGAVGSSDTQFLGLTIAGKSYPVSFDKNTTINVPGVVSITLNYQNVNSNADGIAAQGAGAVITLLKAFKGAALDSTIILNPSFAYVAKAKNPGGATLGGAAYGSYVFAHVGGDGSPTTPDPNAIEVESTRTAYEVMPPTGTNGAVLENHTARVLLRGVLRATAIASTAEGVSSPALNYSKLATRTADVNLFPSLLSALIHADAIGSNAEVRVENGVATMKADSQFVNLTIAGNNIPVDVGPNTTIHIANLGYITLNEQKEVAVPGFFHGIQVIALHIVLDTAKAGLPIGAEIQVGVSQAIVWG